MAKDEKTQPAERTPKPPSVGAFVAKAAFGAMFIVAGFFPPAGSDYGAAYPAMAAVVGLALIAWGVASYFGQKKAWESHRAKMEEAAFNAVKVCKVCGAKSSGTHCEYCDAPLELGE